MKKTLLIAIFTFFAGVLVAGLILIYTPEKSVQAPDREESVAPPVTSTLYASPAQQPRTDLNFVTIAENIGPAVVRIEAEKVEKRQVVSFFGDSPFDDFFDRYFGIPRDRGQEQEFRSTSGGTGFFISSDGYILTNNHIVENAIKVKVTTHQGSEFKGEVIGTDSGTDLALIKIEGKDFPYTQLGDSEKLKVGEWVLAIGNPLGFAHTVTAGIVSAKGRQLSSMIDLPYQDFIQTDAAINRGNSGGPLVNTNAEVVGITSMIYSPSGGNIGIGFAIPSSLAQKIVKQLKENGRVIRAYLGVWMREDLDDDLMKLLNLKSKNGALINSVEPGTPADKAGLKHYDVIVEINGQPVENKNDLLFKIADFAPGTKVDLKIIRDGKEQNISVKLAELKDEKSQETDVQEQDDIGYTVEDLTSSLVRRYGYKTQQGVVIMKVSKYSEAEEEGLQPGDIILELNRQPVSSVRDFNRIIRKLKPGDPYLLLISREINRRDPLEFIVTLRIPE
ncbi:MAG: Do family serine endopeptidase [Candidatus Aminicenantes bacterium]|jgi:serine protease Do